MSFVRFVLTAVAVSSCGSPAASIAQVPRVASHAPAASAAAPAVDPYDRDVPFEMGFTSPSAGDDIQIESIRGDRPDFVAGGTFRVHGHCRLQSRSAADLLLSVTNGDLSGDMRETRVNRGDGAFDLAFTLTKVGWPHLSFYPVGGGDGFGGVYFGHDASLNRTTPPAADMICHPYAAKSLGWILSGGGAKGGDFCVSADDVAPRNGHIPARLKKRPCGNSFAYATLMKVVDVAPYVGKRVRVDVDVRTDGAKGRRDIWARVQAKSSPADGSGLGGAWAALDVRAKRVKVTRWVRTKDVESISCFTKVQREPAWTYGAVLASDFEGLPPTRAWTKYESVVDVDVDAAWILTGVTGRGAGEVWVDEARLEVVPMTTPLTLRAP